MIYRGIVSVLKKNIVQLALLLLLIVSLVVFISSVSKYSNYAYHFNDFDAGIRIVSHSYFESGLLPYKDFGVIYPHGMLLLVGSLINYSHSLETRNALIASIFYIYSIGILPILFYISKRKSYLFLININYYLLITLLIIPYIQYEFFWILLMLSCVLCVHIYLKTEKKSLLFCMFALSLLTVYFRWDMGLNHILLLTSLIFFGRFFFIHEYIKLSKALFSHTLGFLSGTVLLLGYLYHNNMVSEGFEFLVKIPLFVIRRGLASNWLNIEALPFWFFLVAFGLYIWFVKKNKHNNKIGYSQIFYLFLLPYTLGRGDVNQHAMREILFFFGISLILTFNELKMKTFQFILIMCIPLLIYFIWLPDDVFFNRPQNNTALLQLTNELSDCRKYASNKIHNSIFIGKTNYAQHSQNAVILYMMDSLIKPATRYISDEDGMQNTCEYNKIVASELVRVRKPMIAYLEIIESDVLMRCDIIRDYLTTSRFRVMGTCQAYEKTFQVREYY